MFFVLLQAVEYCVLDLKSKQVWRCCTSLQAQTVAPLGWAICASVEMTGLHTKPHIWETFIKVKCPNKRRVKQRFRVTIG